MLHCFIGHTAPWTRWYDRDNPSGNGDYEDLRLQIPVSLKHIPMVLSTSFFSATILMSVCVCVCLSVCLCT